MNTSTHDHSALILGLDLGTSGLRAVLVQKSDRALIAELSVDLPFPQRLGETSEQNPAVWLSALHQLLNQIQQTGLSSNIAHIIADATSSTVLLCDINGQPLSNALMYDDSRAKAQALQIKQSTAQTSVQGANSTLAKVMWLHAEFDQQTCQKPQPQYQIQHQVDWLNYQLCGVLGLTDENNALKLGYDSITQTWPADIRTLCPLELPTVVAAGSELATVTHELIERWNFHPNCKVHAGTTDSIAAFLASGANQIGDAVTALGSTLAIKLLADQPIFNADYGIYSHKLHDQWLIGGASNAGGAVLLHYFSLEEIQQLLPNIHINQPTGLDCYPLTRPGERFPIADAHFLPRIPSTSSRKELLQALIEGLVEVEVQSYLKLQALGAPRVKRIFAVGGGTHNQAWSQLRALRLNAKMATPISQAAAFGVTRLIK